MKLAGAVAVPVGAGTAGESKGKSCLVVLGSETRHDLFHLVPDLAFEGRVRDERLRVQGRHERNAGEVMEAASQGGYRFAAVEQELGCGLTESDDDLRIHDGYAAQQLLSQCCGHASGRKGEGNEVNILSGKSHCLDDSFQKLPRLTDEPGACHHEK